MYTSWDPTTLLSIKITRTKAASVSLGVVCVCVYLVLLVGHVGNRQPVSLFSSDRKGSTSIAKFATSSHTNS